MALKKRTSNIELNTKPNHSLNRFADLLIELTRLEHNFFERRKSKKHVHVSSICRQSWQHCS